MQEAGPEGEWFFWISFALVSFFLQCNPRHVVQQCRIVDHRVQEVRAQGGVAILGAAAEHNIILNLLACPPIK